VSSIDARLVAIGIPGAAAVSQVGTFLPGGPIHDNAELSVLTRPGEVLDPRRIVVASSSNFGAPKANWRKVPMSTSATKATTRSAGSVKMAGWSQCDAFASTAGHPAPQS
jgi:hypothetical protein